MEKTVIAREVDGTPHTVPVADLQLRNSVYGVIIKDGHVLLLPYRDGWDFPGGGMELGETLEEALAREIFEETGLTITPDLSSPLTVGEDFYFHPSKQAPIHSIVIYYRITSFSGIVSDSHFSDNEKQFSKKAEWVPLEKISELKFYCGADAVAVIRKALNV